MARLKMAGLKTAELKTAELKDSELGTSASPLSPLTAIVVVRWQIMANSLRSARGRVDLFARITMWVAFTAAGIGGAYGLGQQAGRFISQGRAEFISILLWPIFVFWQLFPLLTTAFSENLESSSLLRFPISYRTYFFVRIVSGSLDAANALGMLWLLGIAIGITSVNKELLPWSSLALLAFATTNVLLARVLFVWLEHWLARRRTRELMAILFFLLIISAQLVGPLMTGALTDRMSADSKPHTTPISRGLAAAQRLLPPRLAAATIAESARKNPRARTEVFPLLLSYGALFLLLLHLRLRAQYRGEYLGEASSPSDVAKTRMRYAGWDVPGVSAATAAVLEKEFRYLSRSGPALLTFVTPVFMLLVFRSSGRGFFLSDSPQYAFPFAAAYSLLLLANLIYNVFGADGAGVVLFFTSPASFRQIVAAKNIGHAALLTADFAMAGIAAALLFSIPPMSIVAGTLAWILFAVPINLALGNLISILSPKKLDWGTFGRQRASRIAILTSFAVQIFTVGIGAGVWLTSGRMVSVWFATLIFLALAIVSVAGYKFVLNRIDSLAQKHEEALIFELAKS